MKLPAPLFSIVALLSFLSAAHGDDFRIIPNIAYVPNGTEAQTGDLYLPEKDGPPAPLVIVIHGGGWSQGDNQAASTIAISEALARHGYTAFNINYRLVGKGGEYPADVQDVKDSAAYMAANAAKYNIDPARIAMVGESAGGHLALLASYSPDTPPLNAVHYPGQAFHVSAVVSCFGPADFLHGADRNGIVAAYLQVHPDKPDHDTLAAASPITYIATAVPTLLLHGDADTTVPFQQSEELAALLSQHGIKAELTNFPGVGHAFNNEAGRNRDKAISEILRFLGEVFGTKQM